MFVAERCMENMTNRRFGGQVGGQVQVLARQDSMGPWQPRHETLYHHGVDSSRHSVGQSTLGQGPGPSIIGGLATVAGGDAPAFAPPRPVATMSVAPHRERIADA